MPPRLFEAAAFDPEKALNFQSKKDVGEVAYYELKAFFQLYPSTSYVLACSCIA